MKESTKKTLGILILLAIGGFVAYRFTMSGSKTSNADGHPLKPWKRGGRGVKVFSTPEAAVMHTRHRKSPLLNDNRAGDYNSSRQSNGVGTFPSRSIKGGGLGSGDSNKKACPKGMDWCKTLGKCATRNQCWQAGGV